MNNILKKNVPEDFYIFVIFLAITGIRPELSTQS